MLVSATFFQNGVPKIGLTPTVKIWDVATSEVVLPPTAMTEVGDGIYKYDFVGYQSTKQYSFLFDGGPELVPGERYLTASNEIFTATASFGPIADFG